MPHPAFRPSAVALITGAASGIGLALAHHCARAGMRLALADIDGAKLAAAAAALPPAEAETYTLDVSSEAAWADLRTKVDARFGPVSLLALNAGIGLKGGWEDGAYFHKVFDTNLFGVVHGIGAFLSSVRAGGRAAVVITGSKQGITNPPGNAAYNASKAAVRALAEHLAFDLQDSDASVHLLVPGWTFTGLTRAAGVAEKPAGAWAPEQVVAYLDGKMEAGEFYVLCPDNDVSEDLDRRRILWAAGDAAYGRPPLSRWREDWKDKAKEGIEGMVLDPKQ